MKKEIEKIYKEKIKKLKKYDKAYFDDDNPIVSRQKIMMKSNKKLINLEKVQF